MKVRNSSSEISAHLRSHLAVVPCSFASSAPFQLTASRFYKVAARVPFDRILLETDSPYFKNGVPQIHDGGRPVGTMPGDVIYTAVGIAKARGIPLEAVICQCRLNAKNVFGV